MSYKENRGGNQCYTQTGGQTVAGGSVHRRSSPPWSGEAAKSRCQVSSCTTDCNYLA